MTKRRFFLVFISVFLLAIVLIGTFSDFQVNDVKADSETANNLSEIVSKYYNDGNYTKKSQIHLNETAIDEIESYFEGDVQEERTTYYTKTDGRDALFMADYDGTISKVNSGYSTVTEANLTDVQAQLPKAELGQMVHFKYNNGSANYDYRVATDKQGNVMTTGIQQFYVTLDDMLVDGYFNAWNSNTYIVKGNNDKYLLDFLAFAAPCLESTILNTNYISVEGMKLAVEEVVNEGNALNYLSIKMYVVSTNIGTVDNNDLLLTEARIYGGNTQFAENKVNHFNLDGSEAAPAGELDLTYNCQTSYTGVKTYSSPIIEGKTASHQELKYAANGNYLTYFVYYSEVEVWDGSGVSTEFVGEGTQDNPYLISSGSDLAFLRDQVNSGTTYEGSYFKLTKSIDLNKNSLMIGKTAKVDNVAVTYGFAGVFDGNNCAILNINTASNGTDGTGLFYTLLANGKISNLSTYGAVTNNKIKYYGTLVYNVFGTLENCTNYASYTSTSSLAATYNYAGGIAATVRNGAKLISCVNYGAISARENGGGIAAYIEAGVSCENCTNYGELRGYGFRLGGITGYGTGGVFTNCNNYGTVSGTQKVGGIIGSFDNGTTEISNCNNYGTVSGGGSSADYIAGIVGYSKVATIVNCHNYASISGRQWVAGISGRSSGDITNCTNHGDITGTADFIGGIIGASEGTERTISNCINNGDVKGNEYTGGIDGRPYAGNLLINDCINNGSVTAISNYAGGIVGRTDVALTTLNNCQSNGIVAAKYAGIYVGLNKTSDTTGYIIYDNCTTTLTGNAIGYDSTLKAPISLEDLGFKPYKYNVIINHLNLDGSIAAPAYKLNYEFDDAGELDNGLHKYVAPYVVGKTPSLEWLYYADSDETIVINIYYSEIDVWDGSSVSSKFVGAGTVDNPYLISSGSDLAFLRAQVNGGNTYEGKYFKLTKSIDLNKNSLMIGNSATNGFAGTFDGNNCSILNINTQETTTGQYSALFKYLLVGGKVCNLSTYGNYNQVIKMNGVIVGTNNGTIENCTNYVSITPAEGATVGEVHRYTAAIASISYGSIISCTNYGNITGEEYASGITSKIYAGSVIENCVNYGTITGKGWRTAGIVGMADGGSVTECVNYGNVTTGATGNESSAGGIVGRSAATISKCTNYGDITGGVYYTGGIVGFSKQTISGCINYGTINSGSKFAGGIVGETSSTTSECHNYGGITAVGDTAGGIAGYSTKPITNCSNEGSIKAGGYVGGIVGNATGAISNCENTGKVTLANNASYAGGIVGNMTSTITDCVNRGSVTAGTATGNYYVGGIAGQTTQKITGCTNHGSISGYDYIAGIAGRTTAEISNCDNYGESKGRQWIGGIAGNAFTNITNCTNNANVTGTADFIGGIVGASGNNDNKTTITRTITNCVNNGAVKGVGYIGGIDGRPYVGNVTYEDCINNGTVTATSTAVERGSAGGIVGRTNGVFATLIKCQSNGALTAKSAGIYVGLNATSATTGYIIYDSCSTTLTGNAIGYDKTLAAAVPLEGFEYTPSEE